MSELQLFDALAPHIEDALRASIRRFGVLSPITRDQHGRILDGHHRVRIAGELGMGIADDVIIHVEDDDEAREIARTLNSDRRHLTEEQRREVVADLRRAGHSERAIAGALGVSKTTVHRDIEAASTGPDGPVQPERVKSLDGKERPATRPAQPEPPADPEPEPDLLAGDDWVQSGPAVPEPTVHAEPIVERNSHGETPEEEAAAHARLDAELDAEMEGTDVRFRRNFASAAVKAGQIVHFDPDRISEVFPSKWDRDVGDLLRTLTDWCEQVRESRRRHQRAGLRVVGGGADE